MSWADAFGAAHRDRRGALLAGLATLLVAANPAILTLATEILSETPFIFLTLAGLLLSLVIVLAGNLFYTVRIVRKPPYPAMR